ncbi:MAG: carboxypeptidase regulatory-like domain-containing protein [Deltaproteobacteria bacterium]
MKRESCGVVRRSVRTLLFALLCATVLAFSGASRLNAQETGTIVGTVTDSSGAVIPNADVIITNQNTGTVTRTTRSNDAGNYVAAALPASTYTVKCQKQGFQSSVHSDLELNVKSEVRVDFALAVGMVSTEVTVTATSVHLQTENATVSQAVTANHVESLDINGRNFIQLATLVPGAVGQSLIGSLNQPVGVTSNSGVNFNGLRQSHNVFSVDGQENYDRGCGGCIEIIPDQDAIQEFKVTTSNAQQDLGFGSGGRVQLELKSGTSRFHGEAFEVNRNRALETQPFFLNKVGRDRPKENQNDFGFNVGGPIGKPGGNPKTFFFAMMDWRRLILGNTLNVQGIPLGWTTGDFSSGGSNVILDKSQAGVTCVDANGGNQTCYPQFAGNAVPAGMQNSNALLVAAPSASIFLQPTSGTRYIAGYTQPVNVNEQIVRIDHTFSDKTSVMAHYVRNGIVQQFPRGLWDTGSYPTVGTNFLNEPESILLKVTHSISPTLLSESMVGFNRQPLTLLPYGAFQKPSGYNVPELFPSNDDDRLPRINIGGNVGVLHTTGSWPWYNVLNTWSWREALTNIRGNHTLNFGVEVLHYLKQQRLFGQTNGSFNFDGSSTNGYYLVNGVATKTGGNAFADFILGDAQQYNELQTQGTPAWINNHTGLFFGDSWKVKNGLTVNLALRWEAMPHAYEEHLQSSVFRKSLFDPAQAAAYNPVTGNFGGAFNTLGQPFYLNGIGLAGVDVPKGMVDNHWNNFTPRLGFAWQPKPGGKLVVRGGISEFYENVQGNDVYNVGPNPPFSSNPQINNTNFSNPGGGLASPGFPGNIQAYDPTYPQQNSWQWNLGTEYQFTDRTIFSLAYVGNKSTHQNINYNINQPQPSPTAYPGPINSFRPFPGWANINFYSNAANANYNSLQASMRFTNWHGLTSGWAYTWSHCIDYVDNDLGGIPNAYDLARERGHCGFDIRHTLVVNYVYSVPFFNQATGIKRTVAGGWQVSGISSFYSGIALNVGTSQSDSTLAHCNCGGYRANVIGDPNSGPKTVDEWFNTAAFGPAAVGTFGGGRNMARGAGVNNFDFSVFKNFAGIPFPKNKEGANLQLRFEFYNVFNHTQFNSFETTFGRSNFGAATSARLPRQIQLGIKLYF